MKNCFESGKFKALMALLLMFAFCVVSLAQDAGEAATEENVLTAVDQKMLKRISVDFRDTPIDDVITTIAKQVDLDENLLDPIAKRNYKNPVSNFIRIPIKVFSGIKRGGGTIRVAP